MPALGFHVVFRLRDSRAIAPTVVARRRLVRVLFAVGRRHRLLAFRASFDHLHAEVVCDRDEAGTFAQAVGSALTQALDLPVGFAPAHLTPLEDGRHLARTFGYVLRNAEKHGLADDPLHEASSLPDLLGLRIVGTHILPRVRALLPGMQRPQLLDILGVGDLAPACVADWVADAAAGALALPDLAGNAPEAVLARAAAVRAAGSALRTDVLADALGVTERGVRRLRQVPVPPLLERAVGLRMGLRAAHGTRAAPGLVAAATAPRVEELTM